MPAGAYSERFLLVSDPGLIHEVQVPNGLRAVVKCISISNPETTEASCYLLIGAEVVWFSRVPGGESLLERNLHLVYYANAHIGLLIIGGASIVGTVAGYLLRATEPSQVPPVEVRPPLGLDFVRPLPSS